MISISQQDDPSQRQSQATADVECLKKCVNPREIITTSVIISDRQYQVLHAVHHGCLEDVLQELIVDQCPSGFDFQDNPSISTQGVCVEVLINPVVQSKQDRHRDFLKQLRAKEAADKLRRVKEDKAGKAARRAEKKAAKAAKTTKSKAAKK